MTNLIMVTLCSAAFLTSSSRAEDDRAADLKGSVAKAIRPIMEKYGIPGMAVGIVRGGRRGVFDYGVASKETGKPVDADTLFEIGSVSKTFTATPCLLRASGGKAFALRSREQVSPEIAWQPV